MQDHGLHPGAGKLSHLRMNARTALGEIARFLGSSPIGRELVHLDDRPGHLVLRPRRFVRGRDNCPLCGSAEIRQALSGVTAGESRYEFAGHRDWRLPTLVDWHSVMGLDSTLIPDWPNDGDVLGPARSVVHQLIVNSVNKNAVILVRDVLAT